MLSYDDSAPAALMLQSTQLYQQAEMPLWGPPESAQVDVELLAGEVARWCRKASAAPLPAEAVPGTNERERAQLAALGGLARAMACEADVNNLDRNLPPAVRKWLSDGPEPPSDLTRRMLDVVDGPMDPLASIYERIVAGHRRRQLGTFFTAPSVLAYMRRVLDKSLPSTPATVVDPGAGVGAFTTAALEWWPAARVHAVDVNLVTLGLLAARPKKAQCNPGDSFGPQLKIRHQDFLDWLTATWPGQSRPRLILGNPPYTRHQQLSFADKMRAQEACGDLAPGLRAGLSTYFLAAGLRSLGPQDSLCLLIPFNWLEADYGKSIRGHLWKSVNRRVELHLFSNQEGIFSGAQVGAMVAFVGPRTNKREPMEVHHVTGNLTDGFSASESLSLTREGMTPQSFTAESWGRPNKDSHYVRATEMPLGELVHIRRGVATGANRFFLRSLPEWERLGVNQTVRAISRLRDLSSDVLDVKAHDSLSQAGLSCWLLSLTEDSASDPAVSSLLEDGIRDEINERYLCRTRKPWYVLERIVPPDLLIGPMGKQGFRIVVNSVGAIPTNTLYGMRMRKRGDTRASARRLAEWMGSPAGQEALRARARRHGDGLLKLEPGSLATVLIPRHVVES
ncbi:Eco57I restriction-modification methylase domain-containing protein [Streptomyces prasinus]|uniref:Eco57I restriction-modification methylase domain-containing protein n=1 Tax=Streptomyces prasinus TaxID=67345 RepID=UPI00099EF52E